MGRPRRAALGGARVPKFSFQLDVRQPPTQVMGAMLDFSRRRPEIWPNLTARLYRVHNLGPGTADVTEGTALPGVDVWERVTYDWTDSVVRSVVTDGKIFRPGARSSSAPSRTATAAESALTTTGGRRRSWDGASARCSTSVVPRRSSDPSDRSTAGRADELGTYRDLTMEVVGSAGSADQMRSRPRCWPGFPCRYLGSALNASINPSLGSL